jgi:hypothetical protein
MLISRIIKPILNAVGIQGDLLIVEFDQRMA